MVAFAVFATADAAAAATAAPVIVEVFAGVLPLQFIVDPAAVAAAAVLPFCCCVDVVADTAISAVEVVVAYCCYCCCSCYCYIEALSPP